MAKRTADNGLEIELGKVYLNIKNISLIDGTKENKGKVLVILANGSEMWFESKQLVVLE